MVLSERKIHSAEVPLCFLAMQMCPDWRHSALRSEQSGHWGKSFVSEMGTSMGRVAQLLWLTPRTFDFKKKKKKKKTCLINIFVSFRKRCCVTKAEFIFLFSIKWKIKLTYPKNAFPTRKQTNKKPLSFWFLRRAIPFQTSFPALASKHSGYDKPLCQFSSAWFG